MYNEAPKIRLNNDFQIVVLVCLLLEELGSLTDNQLIEIATFDEMVDVFGISNAFGTVEKKKLANIDVEKGITVYSPNENGRLLVKEFINRVPLSVREKAVCEGKRILNITRLKRLLDWTISKKNGSFEFKVKFFNEMTGAVLMEIKLYSPTLESAKDIERRFLEKPSEIIEKTLNSFISDNEVIFFNTNP